VVVGHSLVSHEGGEDGSKGVGCEFFVEPCFAFLHYLGLDGGFSDFSACLFSSDGVAADVDEQFLVVGVVASDELVALECLDGLCVDGVDGVCAAFPVLEPYESVFEHQVVYLQTEDFADSCPGFGE